MAKHIEEEKDLDIGAIYTRSELFMEKNKTAVTIAVVAVFAIVAGLLGYRKFVSEPAAKQAAESIWKAQYYFEIDSLDLALNGDGNYLGFTQLTDEYGSTPAGKLAKFYIAVINPAGKLRSRPTVLQGSRPRRRCAARDGRRQPRRCTCGTGPQ